MGVKNGGNLIDPTYDKMNRSLNNNTNDDSSPTHGTQGEGLQTSLSE